MTTTPREDARMTSSTGTLEYPSSKLACPPRPRSNWSAESLNDGFVSHFNERVMDRANMMLLRTLGRIGMWGRFDEVRRSLPGGVTNATGSEITVENGQGGDLRNGQ